MDQGTPCHEKESARISTTTARRLPDSLAQDDSDGDGDGDSLFVITGIAWVDFCQSCMPRYAALRFACTLLRVISQVDDASSMDSNVEQLDIHPAKRQLRS